MTFERRHLGGRVYALVSTTLEKEGFLAAFTERTGGVSEGPYRALNLSYSVGDLPRSVAGNRSLIVDRLDLRPFAVAGLVHGARILRIGKGRAGAGFEGPEHVIPESDGLITKAARVPLAVTTADCVPLVLASAQEGEVAVVHAGWRGLAAGVVSAAARLFDEPKSVRVAIGPAIGPCHYEVGEDVALAVAAGSESGAISERRNGRVRLDLVATARLILRARGIRRVEDTGLCTACERGRFFSHRRDGVTGRQIAIAARRG